MMGTGMKGYAILMTLTSGMRLVSLFLLASIEPSGLRLRHRARTLAIRTRGIIPGWPTIDVSVIERDSSTPKDVDDRE